MRAEELFHALSIPYVTEGHKHCRPGWINMECPFCAGNAGYHLGFSLNHEYFHCWRCGGHPIIETISEISGLPRNQVKDLLRQYGGRTRITEKEEEVIVRTKGFKFPSGTGEMTEQHRRYLSRRGFDPEKLERIWGLKGTGPIADLDNIDYRFRIIAPIFWNGGVASFQGRDITGKSPMKYRACPKNREIYHHKHILYGLQNEWKEVGICVEGITDVWRMGPSAFATFGIEYTIPQCLEMRKHFKRVVVLFDDDPQAVKQATRLAANLKEMNVPARVESIQGDPGGLSQEDANALLREITRGK